MLRYYSDEAIKFLSSHKGYDLSLCLSRSRPAYESPQFKIESRRHVDLKNRPLLPKDLNEFKLEKYKEPGLLQCGHWRESEFVTSYYSFKVEMHNSAMSQF